MSMLDALVQSGGPQAIARDLGVDEDTARTGMAALLPAVLDGMQKQLWVESGHNAPRFPQPTMFRFRSTRVTGTICPPNTYARPAI